MLKALGVVESNDARYEAFGSVEELRRTVLLGLIGVIGGIALITLWVTAASPLLPHAPATTLAALVLGGLSALSFWLSQRSGRGAAVLIVAGVTATIFALQPVYSFPVVAPWLASIVLAASVLLGRRASVVVALLLSGALFGLEPQAELPLRISVLGLIWATAALAGIGALPLDTALEWSWRSYRQAAETMSELRVRQGELNRVLKSLNETYDRLEETTKELDRARAAAEQARQLTARFAANISHELRTPLNLIIGFAEMMMNAPESYGGRLLPPAYHGDIEAIHRNAKYLANLIDDVLDLSQIDAGRMGLYKDWSAVADLVQEAARAVLALFTHRDLYLTIAVPPDLPTIFVDQVRVRQVLVNLLANAAKFTDRGGATITACAEGNDVVITVSDTGIGIAPDDVPRIFEEFRQLDQSTRRRHLGSGLGLAICKHFIELHGGVIWVESRPGHGSHFSFSLPIRPNVARQVFSPDWEALVRHLPERGVSEPLVLLFTDDPGIIRLFQRHLNGYQVVSLVDEAELRQFLSNAPAPGGVIAVDAPGVSGRDRLQRISKWLPDGTLLLSCALPGQASAGAVLGAADYLVKPVSPEQLRTALARLGTKVRRVLIADDDPDQVRLLAQMVRTAGRRYRVLRAYRGDDALSMLREHHPDALILDLSMPGADGLQILDVLKTSPDLAGIPAILVTAHGYNELLSTTSQISEVGRVGGMGIAGLMEHVKASLAIDSGPVLSGLTPRGARSGQTAFGESQPHPA